MRDTWDIMKHLEYLLHDTQAALWSDVKKLHAINASYNQIINRCIDANENYFYTEAALSRNASDTDWERTAYDFPSAPSLISKILYITDTDGAPIDPIPLQNRDLSGVGVVNRDVNRLAVPGGFWLGHNKIYLNIDGYTQNIRVYYVKRPAELQYGTAEAGAATTMTLDDDTKPSIENDYYNNIEFTIREGTGAGESATASDYVGSTRVLTIDFASTPSTDSVYSSIPETPRGHLEVIAQGAAIRALMFDVAQQGKLTELKAWYTKLEYDLIDYLKNREVMVARSVHMRNFT
jgi:hypothetical protein